MLPFLIQTFLFTTLIRTTNGKEISSKPSFSVDYENDRFMLDGKPFRYISGSIHYFRIHPDLWEDRLRRVRALGLNAIQYYIPWNFHEMEEGKFDFSGIRDFANFSKLAHEQELWTLLRVGPYICGEWENGGLPWWLLNKKHDLKMRSNDAVYKAAVKKWFSELLPRVRPLLRENGGPVLMVQIENEYGSYDACDSHYTAWLRDLTNIYLGKNAVLYTTDGADDKMLRCGSIPGVLPTVDFGVGSSKDISAHFLMQRKYIPKGPLVNSEFYPGWLALWGQKTLMVPSGKAIVQSAQDMYKLGANINFYMIHGGTNFGFWNGAEPSSPCLTSYDYNAPISEAGDLTTNYKMIRSWIKSIEDWPNPPQRMPENNTKLSYGAIRVKHVDFGPSLMAENSCVSSRHPQSFEKLDHPLGFIMYYTILKSCGTNLTVPLLKDFGYVYLEQTYQGTFVNHFYNETVRSISLKNCKVGEKLFIMVENQGRQTYETINDYKGILSKVYLDGKPLVYWEQCKLQIPPIYSELNSNEEQNGKAAGDHGIYFGELEVDRVADTFLDTTGWGKGVVVINGHNLGRYWASMGPQLTLYVPAPFLKKGANSVMIIELEGTNHDCHDRFCTMNSITYPIFNFTRTQEIDDMNLIYSANPAEQI